MPRISLPWAYEPNASLTQCELDGQGVPGCASAPDPNTYRTQFKDGVDVLPWMTQQEDTVIRKMLARAWRAYQACQFMPRCCSPHALLQSHDDGL